MPTAAGSRGSMPRPSSRRQRPGSRIRGSNRLPPGGRFDLVRRDDFGVPAGALLRDALLGLVVDVEDSESLRVAEGPLEVVEERPEEVAAHADARLDGVVERDEMLTEIPNSLEVSHHACHLDPVLEGGPVLGDEERQVRMLPMEAEEDVS